jgi:molybdopterin-containing oxidoreductase family membrane subunit
MMFCNVVAPQAFWFKWCRSNLVVVMIVSMFVNIGMWFERFVIIVTTLPRMWLPGDWGNFSPTWVDIWTFIGTIGMFLALFLLFLRFLPCINIAEVKWTKDDADVHHGEHPEENETTEREFRGEKA